MFALAPQHCYNVHMHSGGAFWVFDSYFHAHIVQMTRKDAPFSVSVFSCGLQECPVSSLSLLLFTENKSSLKYESFANHCHHGL